jgi:hypothetical protein
MKVNLIKRLQEIMLIIAKADEPELNKIGLELIEIEKELMAYQQKKEISKKR